MTDPKSPLQQVREVESAEILVGNECVVESGETPVGTECIAASVETEARTQQCDDAPSLSKTFQKAAYSSVEKYLSRIKYLMFKESYPEIHKEESAFLRDIYKQMKTQLHDRIKGDLKDMFANQRIHSKLCELDNLIKEAEKANSQVSWRPSGNPNEDLRDHRCEVKLKHKKSLKMILKGLQAQNEEFEQKLKENHAEILALKDKVFETDRQNQLELETLTENISVMEDLNSVIEDDLR